VPVFADCHKQQLTQRITISSAAERQSHKMPLDAAASPAERGNSGRKMFGSDDPIIPPQKNHREIFQCHALLLSPK
jgi:hypothetical protein